MKTHMYYDDLAGEWKPATLEELATMDNPSLMVSELDKAGNPGEPLAYEDLVKRRVCPAIPAKPHVIPPVPLPGPRPPACGSISADTELLLRYTLNYIRAFITLLIFAFCIIIGGALGTIGLAVGILLAAIVATLMHQSCKHSANNQKSI